MGGALFSTHPIHSLTVPRLPSPLYHTLSARILSLLQPYYTLLRIPPSVASKSSHGDIDVLAALPQCRNLDSVPHGTLDSQGEKERRYGGGNGEKVTSRVTGPTAQELAKILGADRYSCNGSTTSFALPHPEVEGAHVQVDLALMRLSFSPPISPSSSPSRSSPPPSRTEIGGNAPEQAVPPSEEQDAAAAEAFAWALFERSYSDLSQILGVCIRPLGLTLTDAGLYARIPAIESSAYPSHRSASLLFLTRSPAAALDFLGLDAGAYERGFADEGELYEWVRAGRCYEREMLLRRRSKANDRRRARLRPMFAGFLESCGVGEGRSGAEGEDEVPDGEEEQWAWTRSQALEEAVQRFGKRAEYEEKLRVHAAQMRERALWARIGEAVPCAGEKLNLVVRSLKRWVVIEGGRMTLQDTPDTDNGLETAWTQAMGDLKDKDVIAWVVENYEEAKKRERGRVAHEKFLREMKLPKKPTSEN